MFILQRIHNHHISTWKFNSYDDANNLLNKQIEIEYEGMYFIYDDTYSVTELLKHVVCSKEYERMYDSKGKYVTSELKFTVNTVKEI